MTPAPDLIDRLEKAREGSRELTLHHDGISAPLDSPTLVVLALGVGVQSSTLLEAADRGDLGRKPDVAFFADTKREPWWVYEHLASLQRRTSIPIEVIGERDLGEALRTSKSTVIPAFVAGKEGRPAPLNRSCTRDHKISVITKAIRKRLGLTGKRAPSTPIVEQWMGISTDEIQRVKLSRMPWITLRYPLIEARMSRRDCIRYLEDRQLPVPRKSACTFCPFHDNASWREIRDDPRSWAEACEMDAALRNPEVERTSTKPMFLHRSLVPLCQAPIDDLDGPSFDFNNECDGVCGV